MEEIESLVKKLQDSKKRTFANIADIINNCMSNKSKDVNMIEHYLDYLFDCIYDDIEKLDENSGNFYRNTLNEYYPEYKKK